VRTSLPPATSTAGMTSNDTPAAYPRPGRAPRSAGRRTDRLRRPPLARLRNAHQPGCRPARLLDTCSGRTEQEPQLGEEPGTRLDSIRAHVEGGDAARGVIPDPN